MAYADYTYYSSTYGGTAIAESDFTRLARDASQVIDELTFDRAAVVVDAGTDTDTIDLIKMAMCAVADELQTQESTPGVIQSERIGRHNVTYAEGSVRSEQRRQSDAARRYLRSTDLMYRGFVAGEYSGTYSEDE